MNRAEIKCMHISHKIIGFIGVRMKDKMRTERRKSEQRGRESRKSKPNMQ